MLEYAKQYPQYNFGQHKVRGVLSIAGMCANHCSVLTTAAFEIHATATALLQVHADARSLAGDAR